MVHWHRVKALAMMFLTLRTENGKFEVSQAAGSTSAQATWLVQEENSKSLDSWQRWMTLPVMLSRIFSDFLLFLIGSFLLR